MSNIINYIGTHPDIEEILIITGEVSGAVLAKECCEITRLKKLTIAAKAEQKSDYIICMDKLKEQKPQYMPEKYNIILESELDAFLPENSNFAVLFYLIDRPEKLGVVNSIKPKYLIGEINKEACSSFSIWETYRKNVKNFYIASYTGTKYENMSWTENGTGIALSVIFPMYNIGQYVEKCLRSIRQWEAEYVEYLFVDDGSPDNSAEIVRSYAAKDSRIKLIQKTNGGCASARQCGLEQAQGIYIGFVDPDDYIDPSMFRKLLERAMTGSYEISYCGYNELYEDTGVVQEISDELGWPYNEGTSDPSFINRLIAFRRIAIWRGIYLKDMITRNGIHFYTDLRRFDDLPFKVETLAKARSVVSVPEYLYFYRMARPGQDVSADDERLYVHFQIFDYLDKFLKKEKNREQIDYLQVVKIQTHQWALKKIKPVLIHDYVEQAQKDLLSNVTAQEGRQIIKANCSKTTRLYNFAICNKMDKMVCLLNKYTKD